MKARNLKARLAWYNDVTDIIKIGKKAHLESPTFKDFEFDEGKVDMMLKHYIVYEFLAVCNDDDNNIVGFLIGRNTSSFFGDDLVATDNMVYILPEFRGHGLLKPMIDLFEDWARKHGCKRIDLGVTVGINNDAVCNMYRKLGYKDLGTILSKTVR